MRVQNAVQPSISNHVQTRERDPYKTATVHQFMKVRSHNQSRNFAPFNRRRFAGDGDGETVTVTTAVVVVITIVVAVTVVVTSAGSVAETVRVLYPVKWIADDVGLPIMPSPVVVEAVAVVGSSLSGPRNIWLVGSVWFAARTEYCLFACICGSCTKSPD